MSTSYLKYATNKASTSTNSTSELFIEFDNEAYKSAFTTVVVWIIRFFNEEVNRTDAMTMMTEASKNPKSLAWNTSKSMEQVTNIPEPEEEEPPVLPYPAIEEQRQLSSKQSSETVRMPGVVTKYNDTPPQRPPLSESIWCSPDPHLVPGSATGAEVGSVRSKNYNSTENLPSFSPLLQGPPKKEAMSNSNYWRSTG